MINDLGYDSFLIFGGNSKGKRLKSCLLKIEINLSGTDSIDFGCNLAAVFNYK